MLSRTTVLPFALLITVKAEREGNHEAQRPKLHARAIGMGEVIGWVGGLKGWFYAGRDAAFGPTSF